MPVYDYKCEKCGVSFSLVISVKEKESKKIKCSNVKCKSSRVKPVYSGFFAMTSKKS